MSDVFDDLMEALDRAIDNTSGTPFPERLGEMGVELAGDFGIWAYENFSLPDAPPGYGDPDQGQFTPSVPTPPDQNDAGSQDQSGGPPLDEGGDDNSWSGDDFDYSDYSGEDGTPGPQPQQ